MEIYLVGGAVRDKLLGLKVKEKDWVVVGATPEDMISQGFKQVGKDFPVFLHPKTKEEYALARTERKTGKGYTGFSCYAEPDVTLEQDLMRRDLTVNAIAETKDGRLIDPYHGQQDLKSKTLRHISPAFSEDPVRILRTARFAARFPDFIVDDKTNQLMLDMVENGEVNSLVPERVWKELERALTETAPYRFFEVLEQCHAINILFPEIKSKRTFKPIQQHISKAPITFAMLCHNLKTTEIKNLCHRLHAPKKFFELGMITANHYDDYNNALNLSAEEILELLEQTDAFRRPERFNNFLIACGMIQSITNNNEDSKEKTERLTLALQAANSTPTEKIKEQGITGKDFHDALRTLRMDTISKTIFGR